jgi:hypothetical protein
VCKGGCENYTVVSVFRRKIVIINHDSNVNNFQMYAITLIILLIIGYGRLFPLAIVHILYSEWWELGMGFIIMYYIKSTYKK